jgi:membrane-associated protein
VANTIFQILSEFFARYGYWVVFFGVMLENIGLPIPGETVLLFAGFLACQGHIHLLPAIAVSIAGATVGAAMGYALGWYGGASVINPLLARFPRVARRFEVSRQTFNKYGHWAVFGARFVTGVRVFAGILAGVLRMPFWDFMLFSFAGAVCWSVVIGYIGFLFGNNWDRLLHFVGRVNRAAVAVVVVAAAVLLVFRWVRRRTARQSR